MPKRDAGPRKKENSKRYYPQSEVGRLLKEDARRPVRWRN